MQKHTSHNIHNKDLILNTQSTFSPMPKGQKSHKTNKYNKELNCFKLNSHSSPLVFTCTKTLMGFLPRVETIRSRLFATCRIQRYMKTMVCQIIWQLVLVRKLALSKSQLKFELVIHKDYALQTVNAKY